MLEGKPAFAYNWLGIEHYQISSSQKIAPGKHTIQYDFTYAGGGRGKGGKGTIFVDGSKVAEGDFKQTQSNVYGLDEPADVGTDSNTPVTEACAGRASFNGNISKITVALK